MPTGGNFTNCNCGPDTPACENPTEPLAAVGLCLADGTPIAVAVVRDCTGEVTSEGWIDLATGAWSAGPPPAGTVACGDSRSIQVSGVFCDVDPDTGDVLGLVLVEYSYAADGSIEDVRLVDATTGDTYVPEGEVTTCPAGVTQPERDLVQLCDETADGTGVVLTPFVRDYTRDENGQITGYTDYGLDGEPYTPVGEVGVCQPAPAEECQHCETLPLCDVVPGEESPGPGVEVPWSLVAVDPDPDSEPGQGYLFRLSPPDDPGQVATVRVTSGTTANTVCPPDAPGELVFHNTNDLRFELDDVAQEMSFVRVDLHDFDTFEPVQIHSDSPDPSRLGGTAIWNEAGTQIVPTENDGVGEMYWDSPPPEFGYRIWNTGGGTSCSQLSFAGVTLFFPETPPGEGVATTFLRTVCRDCQGTVLTTVDTELDGATPYTPAGEVGACGAGSGGGGVPAGDVVECDEGSALLVKVCDGESPGPVEPCRDSTTVLLCDVPGEDDAGGPLTVTDTDPPRQNETTLALPGGAPALWSGGTFVFPEDPDASETDGQQVYRVVAAAMQADAPSCDDGTATVTASVRVHLDGPGPGVGTTGRLSLYESGTEVATQPVPLGAPVGYEDTLTVSARVSSAALDAGDVIFELWLETFHVGPKSWTTDQFTADADFGQTGCETQFLRTIVTDCETGETVSVTDTTLDGDPYEVDGDVGQCAPAAACCDPEPCRDSSTVLLCDLDTEGAQGTPTATDTSPTPYPWDDNPIRCVNPLPGGGQDLWDGGTATVPAQESGAGGCTPAQWLTGLAATLQADRPVCDDGTATITVSVTALNDGPATAALNYAGSIRIHRADTGERLADSGSPLGGTPAGQSRTMEATAAGVPADLLAAGQIVVVLDVESWDQTGNTGAAWTLDAFTAEYEYQQDSCVEQFLRTVVTDCETGAVTAVSDTTLDGEPYDVTGDVGQCTTAGGGECCPSETQCPTMFDTECVAVVERSQPAYDNTSLIGGVPGKCGSVQGPQDAPGSGASFACQAGPYSITSWIVDDEEVIAGTPPTFGGGPCGPGTDADPGMHLNWANLLTNLDPSGASWVVDQAEGCAWYVRAEGGPGETVYGAMVVEGDGLNTPGGTWILGPAQSCTETPYTRVYSQDCDGTVLVTWLDQAGDPVDPPEGDLVSCGTGCRSGGGADPECTQHLLEECRWDDTDGDGIGDTGYVELIAVDGCTGDLTVLGTYTDDLTGPYEPVAPVDPPPADDDTAQLGVQAHRLDVAAGSTWTATGLAGLQSVTATAHGGTGLITTDDGDSTLYEGESVTWSVVRGQDAALTGPLVIVTVSGVVTVAWTSVVML